MKLNYDQLKDRKPLNALVHTLLLTMSGKVVSGMSARQYISETYGIDIDHHEYAYVLDAMSRNGTGDAVYHSYNGGDTQYKIK